MGTGKVGEVKEITYTCDRCGTKSNVEMEQFRYNFNIGGHKKDIRVIDTGDLCSICSRNFAETFFNQMVAWCKNDSPNQKTKT